MNQLRVVLIAVGLAALLSAFTFQGQTPSTREQRWKQDLEFFAKKLPVVEKDSAKLFPPAQLQKDVSDVEHDVPQLPDTEVLLRLMRLLAAPGVSHITMWPAEGVFHRYPVRFFWFADGAGITAAAEEYSGALGARVLKIGSMTPEQLEAAVAPYISHENLPWLHELSPNFMLTQEVAMHFGLVAADGSIEMTLAKQGEEQIRLRVTPLAAGTAPKMISVIDVLHLPTPLYRKHPDSYYWYEYLPESRTLYIHYAKCDNEPNRPFKDFSQELFQFADGANDSRKIERVIVDLRLNDGGNSSIIGPLLGGLKSRRKLYAKGGLYALIGRATFSSGLMNAIDFRDRLHAVLIGEPTGGRPNEYGEVRTFSLPNSHITIQYCTKYFHLFEDSDPPTLAPDVLVSPSIADFLAGRDPLLEAALTHSKDAPPPKADAGDHR